MHEMLMCICGDLLFPVCLHILFALIIIRLQCHDHNIKHMSDFGFLISDRSDLHTPHLHSSYIHSSATCLKQNLIYICDIPNERVWFQPASELFILCQLFIWHQLKRHKTLSLYLVVFCKNKPCLWYKLPHYHYVEPRSSLLNMNGCGIPIENIPQLR